ncbi:DUF2190 family protein [Oligella urethralis]|uniref:DUF2190 domain-containing protein n=1 Tax=Oligella urethralis DNF00040 TaxID=1401065 RepID=A0A095Z6Z7_9BURK|nr:DUF2190 family protein [Oligella urethralis]KGF30490.1 hypothetical protein HMPREF2130_06635 [Oligella urethralis DNF00040]
MNHSTTHALLTTTVTAQTDIPANKLVGFDGKICGAGKKALGVSNFDTAAKLPVGVAVFGLLRVIAGAAIEAGVEVGSDAQGRVVPLTAEAKSNGYALDAAAEGEEVRIVRGI